MIAAEATEVTKPEPAYRKIYVLDTNVLLHDPPLLRRSPNIRSSFPFLKSSITSRIGAIKVEP